MGGGGGGGGRGAGGGGGEGGVLWGMLKYVIPRGFFI